MTILGSVWLCFSGFWGGMWPVGIFYEIDMSCLGQASTTWICVMWTIHKPRAWEMECFIHNLKVINERFLATKISKKHKKNTYERKITFNHLPKPKSMKYTQLSTLPSYHSSHNVLKIMARWDRERAKANGIFFS